MNTIWSTYIQKTGTLYSSRLLRFADPFKENYMDAFGIDDRCRILEIGCGPGALAQSLGRWYPHARICGVDRDSSFIAFAREHSPGIEFLEGDATSLPLRTAHSMQRFPIRSQSISSRQGSIASSTGC